VKIPVVTMSMSIVSALRQEGGYAKWAESKAKLPGQT